MTLGPDPISPEGWIRQLFLEVRDINSKIDILIISNKGMDARMTVMETWRTVVEATRAANERQIDQRYRVIGVVSAIIATLAGFLGSVISNLLGWANAFGGKHP